MGRVWTNPGDQHQPVSDDCCPAVGVGQGTHLSYFSPLTFSLVILCSKSTKSDIPKEKGKKAPRVWELGGCANKEVLDYSTPTTNGTPEAALSEDINLVRCIKVRVKVTIGQKLGSKHLEGLSGFGRRVNYIWVSPRSQIMLTAVSVLDHISFFAYVLQIRGTGPGGQLQDLDCSSSDDEGATQNTKPR